jgi:hypothetical protein
MYIQYLSQLKTKKLFTFLMTFTNFKIINSLSNLKNFFITVKSLFVVKEESKTFLQKNLKKLLEQQMLRFALYLDKHVKNFDFCLIHNFLPNFLKKYLPVN